MTIERTLAIIKPDVVERGQQGVVLARILDEGFTVLGMRQLSLSQAQAEGFYAVHRGKPFYDSLCQFMARGPIVVLALEREDAVQHYRKIIGATDPAKAEPGTIRRSHGTSVQENAVHGSDSAENGRLECSFFFSERELL